jgi:hypothetical protein
MQELFGKWCHHSRVLRIGIVGRSITGCTAAIALARFGHRMHNAIDLAAVLAGRAHR